ncbi:MAG: glycosyltransferase [Candidatus Hinthialibacter antarcticus]|nr:glycosyltransferase [Candidatus Hinthialibacter antarcticus]
MNDATHPPTDGWHSYSQLSLPYLAAHQQLLELTAPELLAPITKERPKLATLKVQYQNGAAQQASFDQGDAIALQPGEELMRKFQTKIDEIKTQSPPLIVVAGLGTFAEYQYLQQAAQALPQTIILLIDRDPLALTVNLALFDFRSILLSGAWVWAVGEPLAETLLNQVKAHSLFMTFTNNMDIVFGSNAQDAATAEAYVQAFQTCIGQLAEHCQTLNQASQEFQSNIQTLPKRAAKVWSSGAISEYTSTPILRAIHRGLSSVGVESAFTPLPRGRTRKFVEYEGLVRAQPDIVLSLNDPSHSVVPQGEFHRAVWVTDDPTMRKNLDAFPTYDENEVVFHADHAYLPALIKQGAIRTAHLPVFALLEHEGKHNDEYAFPITFVGMIWNLNPFLEKVSPSDRDLLQEAHQYALVSGTGTLGLREWWAQRDLPASLLQSAQRYFQVSGRVFREDAAALTYLTYMLDMDWRRRRMAEALLPLGLHVFGNRDWLSVLGEKYANRYHGFVPYDRLGDVYRSAQIVIGVHSLQLPGSINIRDCDVLRAGGCFLTDSVSGMNEQAILPGRDCEAANTPEEFVAAAHKLLNHEDRRQQLRQQGMKTIESGFLPQHRAQLILDALKVSS